MDILIDESKRGKDLIIVSHHINFEKIRIVVFIYNVLVYALQGTNISHREGSSENYAQIYALKKRGYFSSKEGIRLHFNFSCFVYGTMYTSPMDSYVVSPPDRWKKSSVFKMALLIDQEIRWELPLPPRKLTHSWWFRNPANSPVEVGSEYSIIYNAFFYIPGG